MRQGTGVGRSGAARRSRVGKVLLCAVASFLLLAAPGDPLLALEANFSSQTYLYVFERDLRGSDNTTGGDTGDKTFAPLYEYLSADAYRIGGKPVSFHFYAFGRQDLGEKTGSGDRTGDIGSAYLQYLHPTGNTRLTLGRFPLSEGVASTEILDGASAKILFADAMGIALFGGIPVEGYPTAAGRGDTLYGGRLFFVLSGTGELGVSYLKETGDFRGGDDRELAGADLWLRPAGPIELVGRAAYNLSTEKFASQRYLLRLFPGGKFELSAGYEQYPYRDLFQWALNPAFLTAKTDAGDEVRALFAAASWEVVGNVVLEGSVRNLSHDLSATGDANRFEAGLKGLYNGRRDAAGVSAAVVTADRPENEYQTYRAYATWSPGKMRLALDGLTHRFKEEFGDLPGKKNAYEVVGSANYEFFPYLRLGADLRYTQSPQFKEDLAVLARATAVFNLVTEGGK
jgi:hypothetical protein